MACLADVKTFTKKENSWGKTKGMYSRAFTKHAQHQGNWNKIMNDDGMKGMGMLKAEAQEIINEAFRSDTLFSDYNKKFLKECRNANITAMKKMLQNEYQLNPTVCATNNKFHKIFNFHERKLLIFLKHVQRVQIL